VNRSWRGRCEAGLLGCVMLVAMCVAAAAQKGKETNDESERILSLENAWNQAEKNHDTKALTMLLGETFDFTDDDGRYMNRRQWLAHISKEEDHFEVLGNSGMVVHLFGDFAVATGVYRSKMGTGLLLSGRFTDVWIKKNGEWKCVASQATLISR
jgi:ketosteroid isomerase-like protein